MKPSLYCKIIYVHDFTIFFVFVNTLILDLTCQQHGHILLSYFKWKTKNLLPHKMIVFVEHWQLDTLERNDLTISGNIQLLSLKEADIIIFSSATSRKSHLNKCSYPGPFLTQGQLIICYTYMKCKRVTRKNRFGLTGSN